MNFVVGMTLMKFCKLSRLRWAGHVICQDDDDLSMRVLLSDPGRKRPRGRPRLPWEDGVKEYAAKLHHHHHPRCYNPCRVLTDSIISLHPSLSMALVLQLLIPSLPASLFTPSIHLRLGLPTLLLPSGIPRVIFLHGRLSCIRTMCPAHINLVFRV